MNCDAVAFRIFKVSDESVFADAHPRHQRLAAVCIDGFQSWIDGVNVDVSTRSQIIAYND
jgi:hypothetical protein